MWLKKLPCTEKGRSKHSASGPYKAHMWQLKWLPPKAHMWATRFLQRWPTCGPHVTVVWPTCGPAVIDKRHLCGRQQAHVWQSTGTEMAIKRHIHVCQCVVHVCQLFRLTKCTYMAINRHTWQSTGTYRPIYMTINSHIKRRRYGSQ